MTKPCPQCKDPPRLVRRGVYYELICPHKNMVDMSTARVVEQWDRWVEEMRK